VQEDQLPGEARWPTRGITDSVLFLAAFGIFVSSVYAFFGLVIGLARPPGEVPPRIDPLPLVLALVPLRACLAIPALLSRGKKAYMAWGTAMGFGFLLSSILSTVLVHSDFIRCVYGDVCAIFLTCILKLPFISRKAMEPESVRRITWVSVLASAFAVEWSLILASSIVTRKAEWVELIVGANICMLGFIGFEFRIILLLRELLLVRVRVGPESLSMDGRDMSGLLGKREMAILHSFTRRRGESIVCAELRDSAGGGVPPDCVLCRSRGYKATACSAYLNIYNQVLRVKKVVETLGIGTILSPEKKANIMQEGWRLMLFDGVRASAIEHPLPHPSAQYPQQVLTSAKAAAPRRRLRGHGRAIRDREEME